MSPHAEDQLRKLIDEAVEKAIAKHMCKFNEEERACVHLFAKNVTPAQVGALIFVGGIFKRTAYVVGCFILMGLLAAAIWGVLKLAKMNLISIAP